jgi:hypothetical protein
VDQDRSRLNALVSSAALDALPALRRREAEPRTGVQLASLDPTPPVASPSNASVANAAPAEWAPAPEFDEDHPEELSYRPFPIAPLLTQSASADDEALVKLVHPDLPRTLDLLDERQIALPMQLRPGSQVTGVQWAQQFRGNAVDFSAQHRDDATGSTSGLTSRAVRTTAR